MIDWAQRQAGDSLTYAVALVYDDDDEELRNPGFGRGLVWLLGADGNTFKSSEADAEIHRRMLLRRAQPVDVPPHDRMPDSVPNPYDGDHKRR